MTKFTRKIVQSDTNNLEIWKNSQPQRKISHKNTLQEDLWSFNKNQGVWT